MFALPAQKLFRVFGFFKGLSYSVRQLPIMAMHIMVNNQVSVFIQLVLTIAVFHVDIIAGVILVRSDISAKIRQSCSSDPFSLNRFSTINNVLPQQISDDEAQYKDVNLLVSSFIRKIRIARGFIDELYVHMGFPKPSAFKTVLELTLEDGQLKETKYRTKEMKKKRGAFKKLYNEHCKCGKIGQAVEEAFSLDMDLE